MNRIIIITLLFLLPWYKVFGQASETEDNYCVEFSGSGDYLDLGDASNLYLTYFTTEFWIYPYYQTDNNYHGFCGNQLNNTTAQRSPSVWIYQQNKVHYGFGSAYWGTKTATITNANAVTLFAWNHVAITFDGIDYCCYVNGSLVWNNKNAKDMKPAKTPIRYFGRIDNYYKGMIDDIRVWSYARTADDIKDNMKTVLSGDEVGLIGYWTFNDQKRTAVDKTARHNDGTLIGPNVRFIKMPLGDEDAIYVLRNAIATQSLKVDQQKDTLISWTFGHKPSDAYTVTLAEVSDATKARVIVKSTDLGDSTQTTMSIKGLKEGMVSAKLVFEYGKYHVEHTFLIDVKNAEDGKLANHTNLGKNGFGQNVNGASLYSNGVYSILDNGGSVNTSTAVDGGTYISWDLKGDGDIQARILNEGDITATAAYGLDIREDASVTNSKSFGAFVNNGKTVQVLSRTQSSASNVNVGGTTTTLPTWLRLNRTGNVLTAYKGTNGTTWTQLSSVSVEMNSTVKAGLLVASGNKDGARKKIKFDNVSLTGSLNVLNPLSDVRVMATQTISFDKVFSVASGNTSYKVSTLPTGLVNIGIQDKILTLTPLAQGTAQVILSAENGTTTVADTFNVQVGLLKDGFEMADIWKSPSLASGNSFASMSNDNITINSVVMDKAATDGTNTSVDGITFIGTKKTKTDNEMQEITVFVKEVDITGEGVRAGVMFRDGFDNGAAQVALSCTAYEGVKLEYRWLKDIRTDSRTISGIKAPCWLKLTNYKGAYNAYYSTNAETTPTSSIDWHCVLGTSLIIQMANAENYVGIFANTNSSRQGVANFSNLKINTYDGSKIACSRTEISEVQVEKATLKCYPNPFNGKTKVEFTNTKKGKVDVRLYNSAGQEISVLFSGTANAGQQTFNVDLSAMPEGMYYCKVITSSGVEVVKLMQIK